MSEIPRAEEADLALTLFEVTSEMLGRMTHDLRRAVRSLHHCLHPILDEGINLSSTERKLLANAALEELRGIRLMVDNAYRRYIRLYDIRSVSEFLKEVRDGDYEQIVLAKRLNTPQVPEARIRYFGVVIDLVIRYMLSEGREGELKVDWENPSATSPFLTVELYHEMKIAEKGPDKEPMLGGSARKEEFLREIALRAERIMQAQGASIKFTPHAVTLRIPIEPSG